MFGILNYNKAKGLTSRDCVNHIQRIIRPIKCGHAGTLDPIAEGVLLIGVGQAVRLVDWIHLLPKTYIAEFSLGQSSPSIDLETEVTELDNPSIPSFSELQAALPQFIGAISQRPPIYSAIRIDGKRAYDLARAGQPVEVPSRNIVVHQFEIIDYCYPKLGLKINCSTGTYVRSLGRDLARCVGSDAVMTALTRTSVGDFFIDSSTTENQLGSIEEIQQALCNPNRALTTLPHFKLSQEFVTAILQGKQLSLDELKISSNCSEIAVSNETGVLQSILCRRYDDSQKWSAKRCFHNPPR